MQAINHSSVLQSQEKTQNVASHGSEEFVRLSQDLWTLMCLTLSASFSIARDDWFYFNFSRNHRGNGITITYP